MVENDDVVALALAPEVIPYGIYAVMVGTTKWLLPAPPLPFV
jgi:hypothetical protein